jgi:hypothetical protein
MDNNSYYEIDISGSELLIISFTSQGKMVRDVQSYDFFNFLENKFPHASRYFYVDIHRTCYHKGIHDKSTNIDETVEYLKHKVKKYKHVIFIGLSSGGYAALLYSSLVGISDVIAFYPQTILRSQNIDEKYRDISKYINDYTKYHLYGDLRKTNVIDCHHISQCERIAHHPNVHLTKKSYINLRYMRDNGELYTIINNVINSRDP